MNNFLKRFVAFAIAAVMICGMLPVSAMAVDNHDHSDHSDTLTFTSTEALIEQVKAELMSEGQTYAEETADQLLVQAVESESEFSYDQVETELMLGFFNNRSGAEGKISTAHLNLNEKTMTALVEHILKAFYLDGIVEVEFVEENGVVTALTFTMRESFAAGLDEVKTVVTDFAATIKDAVENVEIPTLNAETPEAQTEEAEEEKPFPFTDIPEKHWARTAVNYLYQRGIVSGVSATKYGADVNVTRGQAVMMIWRALESPAPKGQNTFTDVKDSDYYAKAVVWAAENGIVSGTGNGKFSPNNNITREQLIAIMYKLAQFMGMDVSAKAQLTGFKDAGKIASWAQEAVKWAIAAGLTSGYSDGTFRPQGTATRAEYAQVLYKFLLNAHTLVHVAAVPSTCTTKGNIEYWYCSKCGKIFADAKGGKEITIADTVLEIDPYAHNPQPVPEVSPTCTATGVAAHYKCACGLMVDANGNLVTDPAQLTLPATGHAPAAGAETTKWNWVRVETDAADGSTALFYDPATGKITAGLAKTVTWECASMSFVCAGCAKEFTCETTVSSYVMTEAWLEETVNAYATELATQLITEYVTEKAMAYYGETGKAPTEEMQNQWVMEAQQNPELMGQVEMAANMKAMELAQNLDSVIYVAKTGNSVKNAEGKTEGLVVQTNEVNATLDQLQRDWATMCSFNAYYSKYFGLVAPYWASKNTEASPMGAVIYMCSQEEQDLIPNAYMDMMVSMLTQAFMSYVYAYSGLMDAMLADAMAQVNYSELDDIDKLLLLHDWLAKYGTFDMQSLVDITSGESDGNDPIAMTAFGVLLNDQIEKGEGATWDGGVCLGYAATYALLVQQAFNKKQADAAIIDFAKIQFLTNVAESSVAAGESGFGDGDAMFNSSHYLNAVNLNGTWYYIDACYDDISTEVISQLRVETDGNVSHMSFLVAPSSWEDMYSDTFQYMDSLYDGKVWQRVFDGESGYKMMDKDRNVYSYAVAQQMKAEAEEKGEPIQMFYYYEAAETNAETRYEDTTYETAWFVSANSAINYDPNTQYFYYTSGAINSYATLKDMFGDADSGSNNGMGNMMDQDDMLQYKYAPGSQDKIVRRSVRATNIPETSDSSYSMSVATDTECEVLFHFGYGTVGAQAHSQFQADLEENSMTGDNSITDEDKGPYYALVQDDAKYLQDYPELVHSTVMMDGKLYFNIGNAIYTFNTNVRDISRQNINSLNNLQLVKVKEYNDVTFASNGKRFTGMSFEVASKGTTISYHPIAALCVRDDFKNEGTETLFVSIGTNFTNSYKPGDAEAYEIEAPNYNPDYYRFMEDDEETSEDTNTNTEYMWCANVVEKMPVADMLKDFSSGKSAVVNVKAFCGKDAFSEVRTTKYGLSTDGVKTVEEGTALTHNYVYNEEEQTNICSVCNEDHEHNYNYEGAIIDIVWKKNGTSLIADAHVPCEDPHCNVPAKADCTVTGPVEDVYTATATYGNLKATETMTMNLFDHAEHTWGAPTFEWTEVKDADGKVTGWAAKATFTCTEGTDVCELPERTKVLDATVSRADDKSDYVASVVGPDGVTYTDTKHSYKITWSWAEVENVPTGEATATATCEYCGNKVNGTVTVTETVTKEPTCYAEGEKVYNGTASFPGGAKDTSKSDSVPVAKTKHEADENKACKHCGEALEGHKHTYGNATYTWNPEKPVYDTEIVSCTQTKTCTTCNGQQNQKDMTDAKVTETIAKADLAVRVDVAAECEKDGQSTYIAIFSDNATASLSVVVKATGHTNATIPGKVATCTEKGLTDGMKCSVCEKILVEQQPIDMLKHDYKDGECTVCQAKDPDYVAPTEPEATEPPATEATEPTT